MGMKKIYFLLALLIGAVLTNTGDSFAATEATGMYQAESLLSEYHKMLENGNTSGILGLLTGPMLKSSENLLRNNPKYAGFLRERYRNSSFTVVNNKLIDASHSLIDVLITFNTQEKIRTRLTLVSEGGRLKIYSEEEISTIER
jgi:hypothetical protein